MTGRVVASLAVVGLLCCGHPRGPRQVDLDAWRDVPVVELESHPHFAVLPVQKRTISDGRQIWDYAKCYSVSGDTRCSTLAGTAWATTNCSHSVGGTECCHDVFIVTGDRVQSFSLQGDGCRTTCQMRPLSRPCTSDDDE